MHKYLLILITNCPKYLFHFPHFYLRYRMNRFLVEIRILSDSGKVWKLRVRENWVNPKLCKINYKLYFHPINI